MFFKGLRTGLLDILRSTVGRYIQSKRGPEVVVNFNTDKNKVGCLSTYRHRVESK